jgi:hypothetical protein
MFVTVFPTPVMSPSSLFRSFSIYLIEEAKTPFWWGWLLALGAPGLPQGDGLLSCHFML